MRDVCELLTVMSWIVDSLRKNRRLLGNHLQTKHLPLIYLILCYLWTRMTCCVSAHGGAGKSIEREAMLSNADRLSI